MMEMTVGEIKDKELGSLYYLGEGSSAEKEHQKEDP